MFRARLGNIILPRFLYFTSLPYKVIKLNRIKYNNHDITKFIAMAHRVFPINPLNLALNM